MRFLVPLLLLLPGAALAQDLQVGDLTIVHPFAIETTGSTGGGYLTVTNAGAEPDALIGIETPVATASLHLSEVSAEGMASMTPVERFEVPAGGTLTLEPGAGHIMLMGLGDDPLEAGETFPATLVFERAGRVDVEFMVESRASAAERAEGAMDHDAMDHGAMDMGSDE